MFDSAKKSAITKDRGAHGRKEKRQLKTHRRVADRVEAVEGECIEAEVDEMEKEALYEGTFFSYDYVEDYGWETVELTPQDMWKEFLAA
jgi:hypothetical protein